MIKKKLSKLCNISMKLKNSVHFLKSPHYYVMLFPPASTEFTAAHSYLIVAISISKYPVFTTHHYTIFLNDCFKILSVNQHDQCTTSYVIDYLHKFLFHDSLDHYMKLHIFYLHCHHRVDNFINATLEHTLKVSDIK